MKKAPKVLTRMRLSCCWGDNLDEKELNDVVNYINELEQQVKKQKEVINKAMIELDTIINDLEKHGDEAPVPSKEELCKIFNILKEATNNE